MASSSSLLKLHRSYFLIGLISSIFACILLIWGYIPLANNLAEGVYFSASWVFGIVGGVTLFFMIFTLGLLIPSTVVKSQAYIERSLGRQFVKTSLFILFLIFFILGAIYWISSSPSIFGPVYPAWMIPFFAWLTILSLVFLFYITLLHTGVSIRQSVKLVMLLLILLAGVVVYMGFWNYGSPRKEDIYYTFLDGQRLLNGANPYERVLTGNMQVNDKYSTYLPMFYYLSWFSQAAGLTAFAEWLSFWRVVFLLFNLLTASLLFYIPSKQNLVTISIFASLFWLFNRWTLHVGKTGDIDFLAIFFMLLSLYIYPRNHLTAYLLLGVSLGLKQMGVFLIPVYLIWVWNEQVIHRWISLIKAVFWIAIIPLLASLPFLVWNWEGYIKSIFFSATRLAMAGFDVYSLDVVLGLKGLVGRVPLLIMLLIVYWVTWKQDVRQYLPALLVMAVFVFFNPVMFTSYMVWIIPFIPLVASDYLGRKKPEQAKLV